MHYNPTAEKFAFTFRDEPAISESSCIKPYPSNLKDKRNEEDEEIDNDCKENINYESKFMSRKPVAEIERNNNSEHSPRLVSASVITSPSVVVPYDQ